MTPEPLPRAAALGLVGCEACGLVVERPEPGTDCPRCGTRLHARKPDALSRTWALLIAALILYLPANLMPVLHTTKFLNHWSNTILSGVVDLWIDGTYDLAIIVFVASVLVPLLKIGALMLLLLQVQFGYRGHPRERTRLYRVLETIGYWSMLDVFAVALLIALVQFGALAHVEPGPGIVAFGAVVVTTMLATLSFDPRLIWDVASRPASPPDAAAAAATEPSRP